MFSSPNTQTCIKTHSRNIAPCLVCRCCWWRWNSALLPLTHSLSLVVFQPLLKLTHTESHGSFYMFTSSSVKHPVVFVWGQKTFPYSYRDLIGGMCNGIHHNTDGSSFPSSAPSLWMGNDWYSSYTSLLLPVSLTTFPLPWSSLTPNWITLQLHLTLYPPTLPHTSTYTLYFSLCFVSLSALLYECDKLWQQWNYISVVTVSPWILFSKLSPLHVQLFPRPQGWPP